MPTSPPGDRSASGRNASTPAPRRAAAREVIVPEALAGERLDRAMAALAPEVSRQRARRLIAAGVVFVGGKRTGIMSRLVRAGERVSWESPATDTASGPRTTSIEPRIAVERAELWIVDKPAGMPVEATRSGTRGTLVDWLERERALGPALVTHRIDAATSGLVVVARDSPARAILNRMFAEHAVGRRYLAVVSPPPTWDEQSIETPLDGRAARTEVVVIARSPLAAALVVRLGTGRTRQIRRHLAGRGHPVVGETATGARTPMRLLLHAFELRLPPLVPGTGEAILATAPPPADFLGPATRLGLSPVDLVELPP